MSRYCVRQMGPRTFDVYILEENRGLFPWSKPSNHWSSTGYSFQTLAYAKNFIASCKADENFQPVVVFDSANDVAWTGQ